MALPDCWRNPHGDGALQTLAAGVLTQDGATRHKKGRPDGRPFSFRMRQDSVVVAVVIAVVVAEVEEVEEVAESRAVQRHVGIIFADSGIREVIAAAMRERLQIPIPLDELEDGDMVGVGVADVAAAGEGRNGDQGNARAIAKEVERLNVAGVIVAAALVQSDKESGGVKQFFVGREMIHDFLNHAFKEVKL